MTDAFTILKTGNFFGSFIETFAAIGIPVPLFYTFILVAACGAIYIRTKNVEMVALTMVLLGSGLSSIADQTISKYFLGVVLIGVAIAAYKVFLDK